MPGRGLSRVEGRPEAEEPAAPERPGRRPPCRELRPPLSTLSGAGGVGASGPRRRTRLSRGTRRVGLGRGRLLKGKPGRFRRRLSGCLGSRPRGRPLGFPGAGVGVTRGRGQPARSLPWGALPGPSLGSDGTCETEKGPLKPRACAFTPGKDVLVSYFQEDVYNNTFK